MPLTGPLAVDLWNVSAEAKRLLDRRTVLLGELRASARQAAVAGAPRVAAEPHDAAGTAPADTAPDGDAVPVASGPRHELPEPTPALTPPTVRPATMVSGPSRPPEVARRRVARFFLGTGVLLLVVAAVVFVAVTWQRAGTGGRAVVMALLLVLSALGAAIAERRELPLTAEALGALSVAMGLLDGYAAWAADLGGLRGADGLVVSAVTFTAVGGAAWAGSRVLGLRTLRVSAALLLQAPVPLLAGHVGSTHASLLPLAVGFAVQAAAEVALLRWAFRMRALSDAGAKADAHAAEGNAARLPRSPAVRVTVWGAGAYWLAAYGLAAAESGSGSAVGVMVLVAVVAGLVAWTLSAFATLRHIASGACTLALLTVVAMLGDRLGGDGSGDLPAAWLPAWTAVLTLTTVALVYAVPRAYRPGPLAVMAVPYAVGLVAALVAVFAAVLSPVAWLGHAWAAEGGMSGSRAFLTPGDTWGFGAAPLVVVPATGLTAMVAAHLLGRGAWWRVIAAVTLASWSAVVPLSADVPLPVAVGWHVAGGVALVLGASKLTGEREPVARCSGIALMALGVSWSLAFAGLSVVVWAVVAGAAGALVRVVPSAWRPGWATGAAAVALGDVAMAARWAEAGAAHTGTVVAVCGAAVVAACCVAARRFADAPVSTRRVADAVTAVGAIAAVCGTAASASRGAPSWTMAVSLGAAAVAASVAVAVRPAQQRPWWAAMAVAAGVSALARGAYSMGLSVAWSGLVAAALAGVVLAASPSAVARRVSLVKAAGTADARAALSMTVEMTSAVLLAAGTVAAASDAWARTAALGVGAVAAAFRTPAGRSALRPVWAPACAGLLVAVAAAGSHAAGLSDAAVAMTAVCVAAALFVAAPYTPCVAALPAVASVLAAAGAFGVMGAAATRPERLWIALAVVGSAGLSAVFTPASRAGGEALRRVSGITGAASLLAAYWAGLGVAGVAVAEAYTLPPGVLLLAGGGWLRRRRPELGSWPAFGVGLAAVLVPSLPLAVADEALLRPALLGAAAIASLVAGARFRLQAPLVMGAGVLSAVAVFQLSAPVVAAYEALPRWAVLAGAGLLLIVLGAGYERRLRNLTRLGRMVRGLD
ncbi:DUF2157 domain-containing protein [Yinghuangia sp. YIM S10712]|uniref:DUF2157 domain-containing protein n=1 Tax=Yinghuangia sp. YIM S10712 TaxID=3436930 RepID=UPI003F52D558